MGIQKALQNDPDNEAAKCNIARSYRNGWGVNKDLIKAAEWFKKADSYDGWSQYGCLYRDGGNGISKDISEALKAYENAVAMNQYDEDCDGYPEDGFAECCIAYIYKNGNGVAKDINKAIHWFKIAGACGDKDAQAELEAMGYSLRDGEWIK